jgi:hypothetical protein
MMPLKKYRILTGLLISSLCMNAQQFQYRGELDTIGQTGFYSIPVTSVLSRYLKTDLSDIRIADNKGQWIPHIIYLPYGNQTDHNVLVDIPVIKKDNSGSRTVVMVSKTAIDKLSNLLLVVNNTTASRFAALSGSDDQINWFTIGDSILLRDPVSMQDIKSAFTINFPPVAYAYFRVIIFNGRNDPLNIKQVMTVTPALQEAVERFVENPKTSFNQTDTIGFSLIRAENTDSFHFDNILLRVDFPKYFERNTRLYLSYPGSIAELSRMNAATDFILSSNHIKGYTTPLGKNKIFFLLIENKDNPPLRINEITTTQENRQIIAYLEKGKEYHLLLDAPEADLPDYDLQNFRNLIPRALPVLSPGKITLLTNDYHNPVKQKNTKWWIWPAIGITILLLSWLTWGLTIDMRSRK